MDNNRKAIRHLVATAISETDRIGRELLSLYKTLDNLRKQCKHPEEVRRPGANIYKCVDCLNERFIPVCTGNENGHPCHLYEGHEGPCEMFFE